MTRSAPQLWRSALLVVLAALFTTWGLAANAQASSSSTMAAEPKNAAIVAIPITDILNRADDDERELARAARKAREPNASARLSTTLDGISRSVDEKLAAFHSDELRSLPVMRLESLERHWEFDARRIERLQLELRQASQPYSDIMAELSRRQGEWEATQASPWVSGLPEALGRRIPAMLTDIAAAEKSLSAPLSQLIELGHRASAVSARIQSNRAEVAAAIENIDQRLLRIDAPPLWAATPTQAIGRDSVQSIEKGLDIEARFSREYGRNAGAVRGVRLLQGLLLLLLLWLAWRHRRQPAPAGSDDSAMLVLRRPLSSWVLLAMLAVMVFEADAPLLVSEAAMLIALVPVLRLLPRHSLRTLGVWPYVAIGLYLLNHLGFLVMDSSYFYRLFQLGMASLTLVITLWLLWRRRGQMEAEPLRIWVRRLAWVCVTLLSVSIVSNVFGNVSLAETLARGVIDSAYLGLLLHAGLTVGTALLRSALAQPAVAGLPFLRTHAAELLRQLQRVLTLTSVLFWVIYSMDRFRVLRPVQSILADVFGRDFEIGKISISLGNVVIFGLSVLVAAWVAGFIRLILRDEVLARMSLPRGVSNSVASLSYYAVLILGFLVALSAAGFQVSQLAIVFGALGVGIGFGLQNIVANFVSGLVLMFERPIQPGDVIDITGVSGEVRQIGMRATLIRTFDGADVVVPNGSLLAGNLTNWTLMDNKRRFEVAVNVAYGSDPVQVLELLSGVARDTPGVASDPAANALMIGYGNSALNFVVRAWTYDFDNWTAIRSELFTRVLRALDEAGIEIPYIQYDLHLRSISEEAGSVLNEAAPARHGAGQRVSSQSPMPPASSGQD
ncbi:mechanosensitive ion channel domain-containing protein [Uliginosibacterium sp. H3]|uniref:Mechanosensitive ion channel domain-containing protein n=1 Tax=Uliginosibacterium silvisoli TaxID=3114758 RepID=A0ABU6K3N0_9RHOO|nr:mechanosensitive ion channel domain-containing protein [Uliginosibacterium sp. H3]